MDMQTAFRISVPTLLPGSSLGLTALLLSAGLMIVGCDSKDAKTVQTLARVNGEEITILQFNEELAHINLETADKETISTQVLENLIDRKLLAEEAMKESLHRTPEVVLETERARSAILEQAYLKHLVNRLTEPGDEEISNYYRKHPDMYASRKQFEIRQLTVPASAMDGDLKAALSNASSLTPAIEWLNKHQYRYSDANISLTTADFPENIASRMNSLGKGQIFMYQEDNQGMINLILSSQPAPLTLAAASRQIHQQLRRLRSGKAIDAEIARLRSQARIEYPHTPASKTN